jgi:DnaJ domain
VFAFSGYRSLLESKALAMVDYYRVLNVSPDASTAEIKSAYRRLARKKHPDLNKGDESTAREFAGLTDAYKILVNPRDRSLFDRRRLKASFSSSDSVFNSDNIHAKRARQMAYERRYNAIIDRMIADERKESLALQRVIFPVVALFISTIFVAIFKPLFWSNSNIPGKLLLLSLFIGGVVHFLRRVHAGLERYTYSSLNIHDSILQDIESDSRPYSRVAAISFLLVGVIASLGIGLLIGNFLGLMTTAMMPNMFSPTLHAEFFFYPPIVVLLVDAMHSLIARFEYRSTA